MQKFSQNAADHVEFAFTTYFHPDIPQGVHPGQNEKKTSFGQMVIHQAPVSLSPQGDTVKATHTHT